MNSKRLLVMLLMLPLATFAQVGNIKTYRIFTAAEGTDHYANGVVMTAFEGDLYCMWQSSPKD